MRFKDIEIYPNDWLGTITHSDMMANDFPVIVDRTEEDVRMISTLNKKRYDDLTPEQKKEWNGVVKGAYNASDMNRVGQAEQYLAELLHEAGYTVNVTPKTDWKMEDFPYLPQLIQIRSDSMSINRAMSGTTGSFHPGALIRLGFETANKIEQYLLEAYKNFQLMQRGYYYSGELFSGEV